MINLFRLNLKMWRSLLSVLNARLYRSLYRSVNLSNALRTYGSPIWWWTTALELNPALEGLAVYCRNQAVLYFRGIYNWGITPSETWEFTCLTTVRDLWSERNCRRSPPRSFPISSSLLLGACTLIINYVLTLLASFLETPSVLNRTAR